MRESCTHERGACGDAVARGAQICDFDVCPRCFNAKERGTGEGLLRSDRGLKETRPMSHVQYLSRGLRLVRGGGAA